jgi:hypothetical protein
VVAQLVASVTLVECVTACAALLFAVTGHAQDTSIRPFMVEEGFVDLRRRLAATRWPSRETVAARLTPGTYGDAT